MNSWLSSCMNPHMRMMSQHESTSSLVPNPHGTMKFMLTYKMVSYLLISHEPNTRTFFAEPPIILLFLKPYIIMAIMILSLNV